MFQIVESFLKGKHAETDNEDAIFINPAFAAVIDGATSKSDFRKNGKTTGQWAVQCVMEALQGRSYPEFLYNPSADGAGRRASGVPLYG